MSLEEIVVIDGLLLFTMSLFLCFKLKNIRSVARISTTMQTSFSTSSGVENPKPRKKSSLYTRTGDRGSSSLYNGERRPKTDITFEALGNQDELNAVLGIAREYCTESNNGLCDMIEEIQSRLFDVGAAIATPLQNSSEEKKTYVKFPSAYTSQLEEWIDEVDGSLPPLKNFVIPSGGFSSTHLNLARTVCRRAERSVVPLVQSEQVDAEVGIYLNRLSDFLFAASRAASIREGKTEIIWKKSKISTD